MGWLEPLAGSTSSSPYRFARFALFPGPGWPVFPFWLRDAWTGVVGRSVASLASILPRFLSEQWRNWIATGVVQSYALKIAYNVGFWPSFLLYRGADHYGYFDRWKTLPHRKNEDTGLEDEFWPQIRPGLDKLIPWDQLSFWLLFYSRGEIATSTVPSVPAFVARFCFNIFAFDTMYYWFHRWMHTPKAYTSWPKHKKHHDMKTVNVYGHLVDSPEEKLCLGLMGVIADLILAHTVGQDLFTQVAVLAYTISNDLHIHCGYTVPWIPYNWFCPQYFHDYHHSQNAGNFGAFFGIPLLSWDWWLGTDAGWRRYRANGDAVRLHRNTWPGVAVDGDLEKSVAGDGVDVATDSK
ncbi:hypothetical protein DFJ74DRAFT_688162 [Hyaloraphidium curvatum]|nr:hypothetical protein DFJ74DRAFT_688162 [Hyaloraphidium curvatum]